MACRAHLRHGVDGAAVVALQEVAEAVIGERHVAEIALGDELAHAAVGAGRVASAVVEEDYMAILGEHAAGGGDGVEGEGAIHFATLAFAFEVHDIYLRQSHLAVALGERHQAILAAFGGLVVRFD